MTPRNLQVELLAPAGDWNSLRAAVENGADAVYFGLDCGFNARARAANFPPGELPAIMAFLRRRGVRGYLTLNTLIFPSELEEFESQVRAAARAGVDAVLVQDLGCAELIRRICPELPIHASTQMTITSAECLASVEELGVERVVLARELSIEEIAEIHAHSPVPLEAFVHGALCVAYSGQCLTSESLGGRSANRGQCAQACRLPYELLCDGEEVDLAEVQYLLSPQDLAAFDLIPRMLAAGVVSFKIEGRLKTPEYVANMTRHYRRAIDSALAGRPVEFSPREIEEMELSFSRGFSPGWLEGCDHKMLVPGISSAKRGVPVGVIESHDRRRVRVRLERRLAVGDGVVFAGDRAKGEEQGGRVFELFQAGAKQPEAEAGARVELTFQHGAIDFARLYPGQALWKTDDPQLTARLKKTYTGPDPLRRVPLDLAISAVAGEPLRVWGTAANGAAAAAATEQPLEIARKHPLTLELLREQFGRLGHTPFELRRVEARIEGGPMVPLSVLGGLRKELIERLEAATAAPPPRALAAGPVLPTLRAEIRQPEIQLAAPPEPAGAQAPRLWVLCRTLPQLEEVCRWVENSGGDSSGIAGLYADFADIREYREAVARAREAGAPLYLATPRIQKPGEMGIFHLLAKQQPSGVLVRNLAGLRYFHGLGIPCAADFSLNAANELTAARLRRWGAERVTASYDLNREQLLELVDAAPPAWLEVVIHQHMPMFHMEHCVFCAVLSPGTNKTNCGRPCDTHLVELRDRIGMEHPLTADVGCRNTLFNAQPQSGAEAAVELLARGVVNYRVELLRDTGAGLTQVLSLYTRLLAGELAGREVWTALRASNRVGVTRGTLETRRDPLALV